MAKNGGFTANQVKFIEWLAHPRAKREPATMAEFGKSIGVSDRTLTRWNKKPEIQEAAIERARSLLKNSLPEIYAKLEQKAIAGSYRHMKLALELSGQYVKREEVNVSGGLVFLPEKE